MTTDRLSMTLMPADLARRIPSVTLATEVADPSAHARFVSGDGSCQWHVLGYDPATGSVFCLFDPGATLGKWTVAELEDLADDSENRVGRNLGFEPRLLSQLLND